MRMLGLALAILAASAPLGASLILEGRNRAREAELAAAKVTASSLIRRAKRLAEVAESSLSADGLPLEIWRPLDALLFDIEQAAAVSKSSAHRLRVDGAPPEPGRRYARIYPRATRTTLATGGNIRFNVDIIDVSVSGVAVEGVLPGIGVGADVVIGARKGRVVRLLPRGLAIEFATPIPEHVLDRDIIL
jgi:hypothetical protein